MRHLLTLTTTELRDLAIHLGGLVGKNKRLASIQAKAERLLREDTED